MQSRRAFTLVELAIVLVVVGLMSAFAISILGDKNNDECQATTEEQLATINASLQTFIATHSRLPKPARLNLGSSNAQFGYEAQGGVTDPMNAAYATDAPGAGVVNTGGVLIGAVPHSSLNLPSSMASDCWGSKFTYAVTNALTSNNFTVGYPGSAAGAITLRTGTLGAPQPLTSTASYVLISHGHDKYGATPLGAGDAAAKHCNASSAAKIDRENCNNDTIFYDSTRNTGDTDQYFDDLVVFASKLQSTEPCPAQTVNWASCTGMSSEILHGASISVTDATPSDTGSVTVTCHDGKLTLSSPTCVNGGPPPATCASEGLNEGEGNYDGACNLTSCCGGVIVNQILPPSCPAAPYSAGSGNCPMGCDNDASDGLTGGQKYCPGVVIAEGTGNYVCSGGVWGASYPFTCNGSNCQSGSASSSFMSETSGCSPPPNCGGGDTLPVMDCYESASCTCN